MNKKIFLLICSLFASYVCYKASSIVATFFIALAFAYLLQPVATKIHEKLRCSYVVAAIVVFLCFTTALFTLLAILIPKIITQAELLAQKIPEFQHSIKNSLVPAIAEKLNQLGPTVSYHVRQVLGNIVSSFGDVLNHTANFLWGYLLSTINLITMGLLLPILLFFFLKDWPAISKNFKVFISKIGFPEINEIWEDADDLMVGFVKSLLNVSLILCIIYVTGLSLIGFEFAVLFGVIGGLAALVPFVGPIMAISSCLAMSLLIHGVHEQQLFILLVFAIGQALDSSFLTPKIVGDRIGLHPTAIVFSVLVASHILGVAGLFLAIPIAGMLKIIFKKFIFISSSEYSRPTNT